MSTTYGIFKEHPNKPDLLDCGAIGFYEYPEDLFVPIAWISNGGYCYWKNDLARFLPDEMPVYPLDNCHGGIFTLLDIKNIVEDES
jgi:hypothetical protein